MIEIIVIAVVALALASEPIVEKKKRPGKKLFYRVIWDKITRRKK